MLLFCNLKFRGKEDKKGESNIMDTLLATILLSD